MSSESLPLPTQQVVVSNNVTLNSITKNNTTTNWLNIPGIAGQAIVSDGLGGLIWGTGGGGGISSILGTTNQINVDTVNGVVTLSLPQNIATISSPTFARLLNSSIGTNNLLLGTNSGSNITTGNNNVLIGDSAGNIIRGGRYNTAIGSGAMSITNPYNIFNGEYNLVIGGQGSGGSLSGIASKNLIIGTFSGLSINTGSNNTIIGNYTGNGLSGGNNCLYIGNNAHESNGDVLYECVIAVSEDATGMGNGTAHISTINGVFTKSPLIAQYIATGYNSSYVCLFDVNPLSGSRGTLIYNNTNGTFKFPYVGVYEVIYDGNFLFGSPPSNNIGIFIQISTDLGNTWDTIVTTATTHTTYLNNMSIGCFINITYSSGTLIRVLFNTSSGYILPTGGTQYIRIKYVST
jgi:hypothetical protein